MSGRGYALATMTPAQFDHVERVYEARRWLDHTGDDGYNAPKPLYGMREKLHVAKVNLSHGYGTVAAAIAPLLVEGSDCYLAAQHPEVVPEMRAGLRALGDDPDRSAAWNLAHRADCLLAGLRVAPLKPAAQAGGSSRDRMVAWR